MYSFLYVTEGVASASSGLPSIFSFLLPLFLASAYIFYLSPYFLILLPFLSFFLCYIIHAFFTLVLFGLPPHVLFFSLFFTFPLTMERRGDALGGVLGAFLTAQVPQRTWAGATAIIYFEFVMAQRRAR